MKKYRVFLFMIVIVLLLVPVYSYFWQVNTVNVLAEPVKAPVQIEKPEMVLKTIEHQVESGDSLWAIAREYRPDEDPWTVIRELQLANGLENDLIHPNQVIKVPGVRE